MISTTDVYRKVVLPKVGWPVIPVLVLPDQPGVQGGPRYIQDTSDIIDELERLHPTPSVLPAAAEQRLACYLAELLADQWLNLPAMYYRWLFPEQRPFLENEWGAMMAPEALPAERLAAARQSMKQFANAATSLGATADTAAAIESSFETLLDLLSAHFLDGHEYLLGATPTLADFAMMGPLYAHLLRDPVSALPQFSPSPV